MLKNKDNQEVTLEQLMVEVNKSVDAKVGAKVDDLKIKIADDIKATVVVPFSEQFTTLNEALGKLVATSGTGAGGSGGGAGQGGGNAGAPSPELNAQVKALNEQVKSQSTEITKIRQEKQAADERSERVEREASIKQSLLNLPFVNEKAASTAFTIVAPMVRRLDDGSLVATSDGTDYPVESFVKDYLDKEHAYLLKGSGYSGSGASAGNAGGRGMARVDISEIKPGMSVEKRQQVMDAIKASIAT